MPPATIANRYHVLREIGRGGMGVVYQVLHKETGAQYALKVLLAHSAGKGESVERFKREVRLPARIQSPHVVQVADSGEAAEEGGAPFYVMELLRGCDLRQLIEAKHRFAPQEVLWILKQVAQCLGQAHTVGIVHRDLKPDNIFLHFADRSQLIVKILDFGIARYAQELLDTGDQAKLTATQAMLGTPLYMAPEQAKGGEGRSEIGPCTDVWAVGMIVFELLTGKTYWTANSIVQHLGQLLFAQMVPASQRAPELPAGFDAWFLRSCSRDCTRRYASVSEQIDELAALLKLKQVDATPPAALVVAVRAKVPPLVDHSGATMALAQLGPRSEATKIVGQRHLMGSAEQNLRAEIVPDPHTNGSSAAAAAVARRSRAVLGGVMILLLGMVVLMVARRKPASDLPRPEPVRDLSAPAADLAEPGAPTAQPVPDAPPPRHPSTPATSRKTPTAEPKRAPKPPRLSPSPTESPKPHRTYIPSGL